MTGYSVTIPPRILAGLRRQAAAATPAECCGALIGVRRGGRLEVRTLIPVANAAREPDHYEIDAHTVRRLEQHAACAAVQVLGFYHSHPLSPAVPSERDLELAVPGYLYMIVDAAHGTVRGWRLRDDRGGFHELAVTPLAGAA